MMDLNLQEWFSKIEAYPYIKDVLLTLVVLTIFFISKKILINRINQNKNLKKNEKINLVKKLNTYLNIALIFFIALFWFAQIQTIFVSLFAIAAAIVVATKELIMCVTGGILISVNKYFKDGDRIEIDSAKGYVIEKNLTTTRILEIGPEKNSQQTTGHVVTIPNSIFLSKSLKNESYFQGYSINSFHFRLEKGVSLSRLEETLLAKANEISLDYIENAKKYISRFCDKEGFDIPSIEPRIKVGIDDKGEVHILLKMPVMNSNIAKIEQDLLRHYVDFMEKNRA